MKYPIDRDVFRSKAMECKSVSDVLHVLLENFRPFGLTRFRFYELASEIERERTGESAYEVQSVVGVESAGHEGEVWRDIQNRSFGIPELFRAGHWMSTRRRVTSEKDEKGDWDYGTETYSFLCFNTADPKPLIYWNKSGYPNVPEPQVEEPADPLVPNRVIVGYDYGAEFLKEVKSRRWIDFPMVLGDKQIGKISVDISKEITGDAPSLNFLVMEAAACISEVTALIDALHLRDSAIGFQEIAEKVSRCESLSDLFDYCVNVLPKMEVFATAYASIFTNLQDFEESERLVLRASSFEELKDQFDLKQYDVPPKVKLGLTPRVFVEGRSLRLQSLTDYQTRNVQLKNWLLRSNYRDKKGKVIPLAWSGNDSQRVTDSFVFSSFLAAPLYDTRGKVNGVFRLTEKRDTQTFYSVREERLFAKICREIIGPKIESLTKLDMERLVFSNLTKVNTLSIRSAKERDFDLYDSVSEALSLFIPEAKAARKKYIFNKVNRNDGTIRRASIGGTMRCDQPLLEKAVPLKTRSTTAVAMALRKPILITHPEGFSGLGELLPTAKCVLVAPILLDDGPPMGAITVASERYDLYLKTHGRLLEVIGRQMAEIFTRSEALNTIGAIRGVSHDIRKPLQAILNIVGEAEISEDHRTQIDRIITFSDEVTTAYFRPEMEMRKLVAASSRDPVNIKKLIEELKIPLERTLDRDEHAVLKPIKVNKALVAKVHSASLKILIFNLLKNACQAEANATSDSADAAGEVRLKCKLSKDGSGIEICTFNRHAKISEEAKLRMLGFAKGADKHSESESLGIGLNIILRIARWYDHNNSIASVYPGVETHGKFKGHTIVKVYLPVPR